MITFFLFAFILILLSAQVPHGVQANLQETRELWQFINSQQMVQPDDQVPDDWNKENQPPPEPIVVEHNLHGTEETDSAPETELEILQIKANTVQRTSSVCDDNDGHATDATESAPETE